MNCGLSDRKCTGFYRVGTLIISVMGVLCVLLPLLIISHFNFPATDDFAYGKSIYWNVRAGKGPAAILSGIWDTTVQYYLTWQGRYFDDLVSAAGVGIALPKYYFLGTYFTLLIFSGAVFLLVSGVLRRIWKWKPMEAAVAAMWVLILQVCCVPSAVEAFFWYVGATGYTLTFALLLLLIFCMLVIYGDRDRCDSARSLENPAEKNKIILRNRGTIGTIGIYLGGILLTVMVAGTNYAVALLAGECLVLMIAFLMLRRRSCRYLLVCFLIFIIGFLCNALSPGNASRLGNVQSLGIFGSIAASLKTMAMFCTWWLQLPVICLSLFILAVGIPQYYEVKDSETAAEMKLRMPLWGLSMIPIGFGLMASLLTPPYFAGATWGPERLTNVAYYLFCFWCPFSLLYLCGMLGQRIRIIGKGMESWAVFCNRKKGVLMVLVLLLGLGFLISAKRFGLQSINPASAALSLAKGEAASFREENLERWQILTDETCDESELPAYSVMPRVLFHDDITEDAEDWRNQTVSNFFEKKRVKRIPRE